MCNVFLLAGLVLIHYRKVGKPSILRDYYFPALGIKLTSGLLLGVVYQFYYQGGDTFNFFHDASLLAQLALSSPSQYVQAMVNNQHLPPDLLFGDQPRALFFAKLVSLPCLLSGFNYWFTSLYFSLFCFFSTWYLCRVLVLHFQASRAVAIGFFFYPSAVFWSAGLLKESMAVGLIFLMVSLVLEWIKNKENRLIIVFQAAVFMIGALLLWPLKYYYAAVLVPLLLFLAVFYRMNFRHSYHKIGMVLTLIVLLFAATWIHPNLYAVNFLQALVKNHNLMLQATQWENAIHFWDLQPSWGSIMLNLPLAFFSGLFRPLPGDGITFLHALTGLENCLLLLITAGAGYAFIRKKIKIGERLLVGTTLFYIAALSVFLALSSPTFGTLMRYKAAFLPFLLYLSLRGCKPWFDNFVLKYFPSQRMKKI